MARKMVWIERPTTFTARRDDDGHRAVSLSALVAPYVGAMAAVYGWYPGRFGAKDAFPKWATTAC
jgi:hypothetical protein